MSLGGRVLTNTLAAVRLRLAGYYAPALSVVRDSVECAMLLGLFEAAREELALWRETTDSRERWRTFSPAAVKKKLEMRNVWHRYECLRPPFRDGRASDSAELAALNESRARATNGRPVCRPELAEKTLQDIAIAASDGAYQIVDILNVREGFFAELRELDDALEMWTNAG